MLISRVVKQQQLIFINEVRDLKLLVVSDSHGDRQSLIDLHTRYKDDVDEFIHCGDSELQADDEALEGFKIVAGNCDYDFRLKDRQTFEMEGKKIIVVHGHRHRVNSSFMNLSYLAEEANADFVFFGHTHILGVEEVNGVIYLNPGSILLPRGGNPKTYAIIDKKDDKLSVHYYNEKHKKLKTVQF